MYVSARMKHTQRNSAACSNWHILFIVNERNTEFLLCPPYNSNHAFFETFNLVLKNSIIFCMYVCVCVSSVSESQTNREEEEEEKYDENESECV